MDKPSIYIEENGLLLLLSDLPQRPAYYEQLKTYLQKDTKLYTSTFALSELFCLCYSLTSSSDKEEISLQFIPCLRQLEELFEEIFLLDISDLERALRMYQRKEWGYSQALHLSLAYSRNVQAIFAPRAAYPNVSFIKIIPLP